MEATLHALGGILLKALPTLILLAILHLYLKSVFFRPLEQVLAKRRAMTEGARESAEALLRRASEKAAEYELKLRDARGEIYREQEDMRRRWVEDQNKRIEEARLHTREMIRQAKEQIEAETAAGKRELAASSEALADQIAHSLVRRAG